MVKLINFTEVNPISKHEDKLINKEIHSTITKKIILERGKNLKLISNCLKLNILLVAPLELTL